MRFMVMHKADQSSESGLPPSPGLIERMNTLIQEGLQAGVFLAGEGLHPSSTRVRLQFEKGKCTQLEGPYKGSNELLAGFAILRVKSRDEAIEWAKRYAEVVGDAELEVGPVVEPWDLGFGPKPPADSPKRFMVTHKADKESEAGTPPSPKMAAKMNKLIDEMTKAGVLLSSEGLEPSAKGARLRFKKGECAVMDGPFAESKELIAGFSILNLKSKEEAIEWSKRFSKAIGEDVELEVDIRQVAER